ncbi:Uncharacterised protein [Paenibacillus thiaminolyticus]|nr:Uncharacterised protein [Paenibacillus thiaminolyticus]
MRRTNALNRWDIEHKGLKGDIMGIRQKTQASEGLR